MSLQYPWVKPKERTTAPDDGIPIDKLNENTPKFRLPLIHFICTCKFHNH